MPPIAPPPESSALRRWLAPLAALVAAVVVYLPSLRGEFIWNDADYVTRPELRSLGGLWRIWFEVGATEQYYPLLHSFFWVQHRLFGDNPFGYHLVNVLLHAACAAMLVLVVRRLFAGDPVGPALAQGRLDSSPPNRSAASGDPTRSEHPETIALLSGLIFAVHPVYVESVAWISEQKNTFSLLWYLLAGAVYLGGAGAGGRAEAPPQPYPWWQSRRYWLATSLFLCALLSKSLTASLPAALLVLAWWRTGRLERRTWIPLVPWLVCGALAGAFTGWVEHTYIGAKGDDFALNPIERGLLAGRVIWFYLGKYFWPADLIFIYPRWTVSLTTWWQWLFPAAAIGLLAGLWSLRHRSRGPLAASLLFVGSLVPTIGFFNVYAFKFSYVADHWNYLPSLALAVSAAWGAAWLAARFEGKAGPRARPGSDRTLAAGAPPRPYLLLAAAPVLLLLAVLSWRLTGHYRNLEVFYETTLARNPQAWMAHQNLGAIRVAQGRIEEGIAHFQRELELRPNEAEAENNYGSALARLGRHPEALARFERAVQLKPGYAEAWYNLGMALRDAGRVPEAVTALRETVRLRPEAAEALAELGGIAAEAGRIPEAIGHFEQFARLRPDNPDAHLNLAQALAAGGRLAEAIARLEAAIARRPEAALCNGLGALLAQAGRPADARRQFEQAIALEPKSGGAWFNLGILQAQGGRVADAVRSFEQAVTHDAGNADAHLALAQAYAETGRPREAQAAQARGLELRNRR
jgi:tetratricopeptide (TPR) repeat protein